MTWGKEEGQEVIISDTMETANSCYYDDPSDMTYGRRVAMFLSKFGWYYPHGRVDDGKGGEKSENAVEVIGGERKRPKPSLAIAWEYFEHIVLPRCYVTTEQDGGDGGDGNGDGKKKKKPVLVRAEPGELEKPTKLYSVLGTTNEDMSDFGIGVGLYFSTIKFLCVISLVAGLINIPNILFFTSSEYQGTTSSTDISIPTLTGLTGK